MDYTAMEQYWIWLSSVEGIGAKRFYQLLSLYEDARSVWDALGGILAPPDIREALGPATFEKLRAARDECYFYRLFDRLELIAQPHLGQCLARPLASFGGADAGKVAAEKLSKYFEGAHI